MDHKVIPNVATRLRKASGEAPLLAARDLGVTRDGRWLVRGVSLSVRLGEIVTLIGPNGGGKTTTAKALLGLVPVSAGSVTRRAKLRVGYVPQKLAIDGTLPLTVARLMTLTATATPDAIHQALTRVDVAHLANAPVQRLSGGEFQRVLLARALVRRPEILVLDEPVQGVDFTGEIAIYELISDIRDELGCGVLLISHDLHIVMAATDQVICLNGHMCCSGSPKSVSESDEYHRLFGPRAARSLAVYRHEHDHTHGHHGEVVPLHHTDHAHETCGHAAPPANLSSPTGSPERKPPAKTKSQPDA